MAKKLIKQYLPDPRKISENKYLQIFGKWLHIPNLWLLNRYSVATAFSIGLFSGYLPIPGHMVAAAFLAILFRANLPLSVLLVWYSNPFTIPPQFYLAYKLGAWILQIPHKPFHFEISMEWLMSELHTFAIPLFLGSLILGLVLAIIGNISIRLFWRYSVSRDWKNRAQMRSGLHHSDDLKSTTLEKASSSELI